MPANHPACVVIVSQSDGALYEQKDVSGTVIGWAMSLSMAITERIDSTTRRRKLSLSVPLTGLESSHDLDAKIRSTIIARVENEGFIEPTRIIMQQFKSL